MIPGEKYFSPAIIPLIPRPVCCFLKQRFNNSFNLPHFYDIDPLIRRFRNFTIPFNTGKEG